MREDLPLRHIRSNVRTPTHEPAHSLQPFVKPFSATIREMHMPHAGQLGKHARATSFAIIVSRGQDSRYANSPLAICIFPTRDMPAPDLHVPASAGQPKRRLFVAIPHSDYDSAQVIDLHSRVHRRVA